MHFFFSLLINSRLNANFDWAIWCRRLLLDLSLKIDSQPCKKLRGDRKLVIPRWNLNGITSFLIGSPVNRHTWFRLWHQFKDWGLIMHQTGDLTISRAVDRQVTSLWHYQSPVLNLMWQSKARVSVYRCFNQEWSNSIKILSRNHQFTIPSELLVWLRIYFQWQI